MNPLSIHQVMQHMFLRVTPYADGAQVLENIKVAASRLTDNINPLYADKVCLVVSRNTMRKLSRNEAFVREFEQPITVEEQQAGVFGTVLGYRIYSDAVIPEHVRIWSPVEDDLIHFVSLCV